MEAHEKVEILKALESGREAFLDALNAITEDLARRSPAPGRWSALECVEHVAISEDFLFSQVTQATPSDVPVVNQEREVRILARGTDRTNPVVSPEVGRPTGRFSLLADAVQHFLDRRERTVRFVESCQEDLRSKLTTHPLLGPVNCYEALLLMAVHPQRHAKQIQEIKTALGYVTLNAL
jgi:hypothetical protein